MSNDSVLTPDERSKSILAYLDSKGVDTSEHSIFSASASGRVDKCPSSFIPNLVAENTDSFASYEGTVAHDVADEWLRTGEKPIHLLGKTFVNKSGEFEVTVDKEMLSYVEDYVDYCNNIPGLKFSETRVDYSSVTPIDGQFGTADHIAIVGKPVSKVYITDLKYGRGVEVNAKNNSQFLRYAIGVFDLYDDLYDFEEIEMRVAQPRTFNYQSWCIKRDEFLKLKHEIKERNYAAWCGDLKFMAGDQCTFCKIRHNCKSRALLMHDVLNLNDCDLVQHYGEDDLSAFTDILEGGYDLELPKINDLSVEQKAAILKHKDSIERFLKDVYFDSLSTAKGGDSVPGFKLVAGRSTRFIKDESDAEKQLKELGLTNDDIYTSKFASLTGLEKALRNAGLAKKEVQVLFDEICDKKDGEPRLVLETAKGKAITYDVGFENLDDEL